MRLFRKGQVSFAFFRLAAARRGSAPLQTGLAFACEMQARRSVVFVRSDINKDRNVAIMDFTGAAICHEVTVTV
jgi:hypothetical protein